MPPFRLDFHLDAASFLEAAGTYLAADPVVSTVVTGMAHRVVSRLADGVVQPEHDWWLSVLDAAGNVVGVGMRTATFEPRPLFLLPMPDEAAIDLAQSLVARGEPVLALNGALPAVRIVADELARRTGGMVRVAQHTRLFEVVEVVAPTSSAGRLAAVTEADMDLVTEWTTAFMGDADEQAGRPRGASAHDVPDKARLLDRIRADQLWFWLDESANPVHLTGVSPPSFGVVRIGPVYTPPIERGRGWASNAVAKVSQQQLDHGARVCLFTDQANPTSNRIYAGLGYRPICDMANLAIDH